VLKRVGYGVCCLWDGLGGFVAVRCGGLFEAVGSLGIWWMVLWLTQHTAVRVGWRGFR